VEEDICETSPVVKQVASRLLRHVGGGTVPRVIRDLLASEIIRVYGLEDFKAALLLGCAEACMKFIPGKGSDIPNWLSWNVPNETAKWVYWRELHSLDTDVLTYMPDLNLNSYEDQIGIIATELNLSRQLRSYYVSKRKELH
jgi:hypothetical protein